MIKQTLLRHIFFLLLFSYLIILSLPFYLFRFNVNLAFLFSIIFITVYMLILEVLFNIFYRKTFKKPYRFIPKLPFDRMYVEPHPYLPFVYKRNFTLQKAMPVEYPLHKEKGYIFSELKTNNYRHTNGPYGDRDIKVPKPENLIRINCMGASETADYIFYKDRNFSYPMELEDILKNSFPEENNIDIEVNNCGQAGYTSAGILIKFLLDSIDTGPDIIVIYHGYNDLWPLLTNPFQADYSHAKRNLGEVYHLYKKVSKIPSFPLNHWNYIVNNHVFSQNMRFSLLRVITQNRSDINNEFNNIDIFKRNVEYMIEVSKANSIHVILSTFCYYLYPGIKDDKRRLKYEEGIRLENEKIRELAYKHNLPLVDNDCLIPKDMKYFVDTTHFTPEGMQLLAKNISKPIVDYVRNIKNKQIDFM